ncbi:RagB/SusD family nutrient uptake outer membrane protein [Sphingobacterium sp. SYP-B4668]|uniref:RagB/SusD family nutrient uptake outer membrane protein n=1 Tax=Sphingobacterium sp. SYP-B4668 TaxID=2996035 RepID=UPI0022DD1E20|nr:RagB/SusD family nutrient uptake outer membrane protein [Sphingobacterium sp. SYP-B4668]
MKTFRYSASRHSHYWLVIYCLSIFSSCSDYLDTKPSAQMRVPKTLTDCRALLDDYNTMNQSYPTMGEIGSDNFYLEHEYWQALATLEERGAYIWQKNQYSSVFEWAGPYKVIYNANQVLRTLKGIDPKVAVAEYNEVEGAAHFFRAYAYSQLAQLYTTPYDANTADEQSGLPLKMDPDLDEPIERSTLAETYDRILSDYRSAARLLPTSTDMVTRPSKVAAWAALSRIHMAMGSYDEAKLYADSVLMQGYDLMKYTTLDKSSLTPFARFNDEVIFHSICMGASAFQQGSCKIDSTLYRSYANGDLRKELFFMDNGDGSYSFKGNYDGLFNQAPFNGLAVDEILLNRAECYAREKDIDAARQDINALLSSRWENGDLGPISTTDSEVLLGIILDERRKQLVFRNIRWSDLRRLNMETSRQTTLQRKMAGITYELKPNDKRYTLLIPHKVVQMSGIEQNEHD